MKAKKTLTKKPIRSSSKATARARKSRSSSTSKTYPSFKMGKYFVKMEMTAPKEPATTNIIADLVQIFNACLQQLALPYKVKKAEVCEGFEE